MKEEDSITGETLEKPVVSIGMPVYNEEKYLAQALDSLLAQDIHDIEIIISDNASTDSTPNICEQYAARDGRISYYRNGSNIGGVKNFNSVFRLANGEYFTWASGHDLRSPDFLSSCCEVLSSDSEVVLCCSQATWIDPDGNPIGVIPSVYDTRGLALIERFNMILWGMKYFFPIYGVIRSSELKKTSLFGPIVGSDVLLLNELSILGTFASVPGPQFYMRRFEDSFTMKRSIDRSIANYHTGWFAYLTYWRMIYENIVVLAKHMDSIADKIIVSLSILVSMNKKYRGILHELRDLR